jgi:Domain of unknown function (DUF5069)
MPAGHASIPIRIEFAIELRRRSDFDFPGRHQTRRYIPYLHNFIHFRNVPPTIRQVRYHQNCEVQVGTLFLAGENLIAQIVSAMSNLPLNFSIHSGVGCDAAHEFRRAEDSSRRTGCPARSRWVGCPLDQRFLFFSGLKLDDIPDLLKAGKSDPEVLAWIREHSSRSEPEIMVWSQYELQRAPPDAEGREYY